MINKIIKSIKKNAEWGLIALIIVGFSAAPIKNLVVNNRFEKTPYVAKGVNTIGISYYRYDDNRDGGVDRIEETGILPSSRALPVPIRRTHHYGNPRFDFYLAQLTSSGGNWLNTR